jgi:hypothetical protein
MYDQFVFRMYGEQIDQKKVVMQAQASLHGSRISAHQVKAEG